MTPQEMFNKAYLGVIQQGKKSQDSTGGCAYRGSNNTKCGIGHLIPDDLAAVWDDLDNSSISNVIRLQMVPDFLQENKTLAIRLQEAHDGCYDNYEFIEDFEHNMAAVARDFELTIPQLETSK